MIKYFLILILIFLIFLKRSMYEETNTFNFSGFDGTDSGVKTDSATYDPTLYRDDSKIDYKKITVEKELGIEGASDLFNKEINCDNKVLNYVEINPNEKKIKYKCVDINNKTSYKLGTTPVSSSSSNVWVMNGKTIECDENPLTGFTLTNNERGVKQGVYNCASSFEKPEESSCRFFTTPPIEKTDFLEGKNDENFKTMCDEKEFLTQLEFDEIQSGIEKGKVRLKYKCCSPKYVIFSDRSNVVRMIENSNFTENTLPNLGLITCNKKIKNSEYTYGSALNKLNITNDPDKPNDFQARYNCMGGISEASHYGKNTEGKIDCGKHPITQFKFNDGKKVEYACNKTEITGSCEEKTTPTTNKITDHNIDCGMNRTLSYIELNKLKDSYSFKYKCCDNIFKKNE